MTKLLWSIVRAAHCRCTHQCFAVDALPLVQTPSGKRLVGHLLRHYRRYLAGAQDPDLRFRDFQNHVVHVNDGFWGGAPRVAHQWYDRLLRYLRSDRFSDAAHAAGVLSHYFTDPFQPLHTQSSDRGAVVHRPFEWSIRQSYDAILNCWREDQMRVVFSLSDRPQWLGEAILHGARFANRKYERLVNDYDLPRAVKHPADGLSADLRASMAEIFGIAITGWARVIERTALDAEATRMKELPRAGGLTGGLMAIADATGRAPMGWWKRRADYRREQQAVEDLYEEFTRRGRLQDQLPAEVDIVQRVIEVYRKDLRWKQLRQARLADSRTSQRSSMTEAGQANALASPATLPIPDATRAGQSQPQSQPQFQPGRRRAA